MHTGSRGRKAEFNPTLAQDDVGSPARGGGGAGAGGSGGGFANPLMASRSGAAGTPRTNPLSASHGGASGRSGGKTATSLGDLKRASSRSRLKGAAVEAGGDDE